MPTVDFHWVRAQLAEAKAKEVAGNAAIALLQEWSAMNLPEQSKEDALLLFEKLARTITLVEPTDAVWIPGRRGAMVRAQQIRVRSDAYEGAKGVALNGREGVVVALRSGDVIINLTDKKGPIAEGIHVDPEKLLIKQ